MRYLLATLVAATILFIIGFYTYSRFILITIPKAETYSWNSFGMDLHLARTLAYCIGLSLVPIMTAVISFLCRLNKIHERFQIAGIIFLCMFVVVLLRHLWLRFDLSTLSEYVAENAVSVYSLDHMKMELYLLYGIGFGSAIAFLIGKKKYKKGTTSANISFMQ